MKIEFDQICAIVVFLVCAALICFHLDSEVKVTMTLAVGFLFGSGYQARLKSHKGEPKK